MNKSSWKSVKVLLGKLFTRQNLRKIICYDPWRRFAALVIAIVLWGILHYGNVDSQRWIQLQDVPVTFDSSRFRQEGIWIEDVPRTITVNLAQSYSKSGKNITAENFEIKLEPKHFSGIVPERPSPDAPGVFTYRLSTADVVAKPANVSIRSFEPETITVKWDRLTTRQVQVGIISNTEDLPANLQFTISPAKKLVSVTGPEYKVRELETIYSQPITINKNHTSMIARMETDPQLTLAESDRNINCSITFTKTDEIITKVISQVRIKLLDRPDTLQIYDNNAPIPTAVDVTVHGPRKKVNDLSADNLIAYCDLSPLAANGVFQVNVQLFGIDPSITVTKISPGKIRIKLIPRQKAAASGEKK